jgi:DNA-binding Lrp family transcriptional regulator
VNARIAKLRERGIIKKFILKMECEALGLIPVLIIVFANGFENEMAYSETLGSNRAISEVCTCIGSRYVVLGFCELSEIQELRVFLSKVEETSNFEIHPLVSHIGKYHELTRTQKRILSCLLDNARLRTNEISDKTELAERTVRTALRKARDYCGIRFSIILNPHMEENLGFWAIVEWNERKLDTETLVTEFNNVLAYHVLEYYVSALHPILYAFIISENVKAMILTSNLLKRLHGVSSLEILVGKKWASYQSSMDSLLKLKLTQ